jgi:hypothetical protein
MEIAGEWVQCPDGVARPMVLVAVRSADGSLQRQHFLIDTGADRTVLDASFVARLGLTGQDPSGIGLEGIGGRQAIVRVTAALVFETTEGGTARVEGDFAAFVDPAATDSSILGRDILEHFDLILGRDRGEIRLLARNYRYQIHRG